MLIRHIRTAAAGIITASILWGGVAVAADKPASTAPKSDAVKSFESVLQRAGEQGFVVIDSQVKQPAPGKPASHNEDIMAPDIEDFGTINCNVTSVLDLSIYQSVSSYEAISLVKSGLEKQGGLEDVMPLVKTYMALGLGTEMASSARNFKGHEARLIESMGRVIDGNHSSSDQNIITQYSNCSADMKLWSVFTKASQALFNTDDEVFELSRENQEFLEDLPPNLKKLVTLRLGIYAAEQKSDPLAIRILSSLAPNTKYGELPALKDDAILYYYGLVRQMKGDPAASQVFTHLAQFDGLYRTRSLQNLAEESLHQGTKLYENFTDDLAAVSQQYNGQAESRQATLQVVKHRLQADQFIDAIEQSIREFAPIDAERIEAVIFAAEHILLRLRDKQKNQQLHALNAYLHDPLFFSKYENIEVLKAQAKETAIDLNLPELVSLISPETPALSKDEKTFLAYTSALIAAKQGDYDRVIDIAKPYKADPEFQALILDAAIQSGNYKQTIESLRHKTANAERFALQSDIAWQKGRWGEAKISLEALAHRVPDIAVSKKIAIANYVGTESLAYVDRAVPKTAADLDLLKVQLDTDIALVKGYLSNG